MMKIWGNYRGYLSAKIRNTETFSTLKLIDCVKVLRPTRHKMGYFGDVLTSQSLGLIVSSIFRIKIKQYS